MRGQLLPTFGYWSAFAVTVGKLFPTARADHKGICQPIDLFIPAAASNRQGSVLVRATKQPHGTCLQRESCNGPDWREIGHSAHLGRRTIRVRRFWASAAGDERVSLRLPTNATKTLRRGAKHRRAKLLGWQG